MKTKILIDLGEMMEKREVILNVNNEIHCLEVFPNEILHPMQQSFVDHYGIQCGFCSPRMILTGVAAVENQDKPLNRDEIREVISGNLCRCTGYAKIIDAIEDVSKKQN